MPLVDRYGFIEGPQYTSHYNDLDFASFQENKEKWYDMINNWDKVMSSNFNKFKESVRDGIPHNLRSCVWQLMTGSFIGRANDHGYMDILISKEGDEANVELIERDLHRNYTNHKLFIEKDGIGQTSLFRILKAYSFSKGSAGFCQAFGPLAGFMIINMPLLDAFYCFRVVNDYYLTGYCMEDMDAVVIDIRVTMALLEKSCPIAYKHLTDLDLCPMIWMMEWYVTVYTRMLPWPTLLRVWDMFLCEGVKVIFAVALTLVKLLLGTKKKVDASPGFYECMTIFKTPPVELLEDIVFIPLVAKSIVSSSTLAKEQKNQVTKLLLEKSIKNNKLATQKNNNNSAFTPQEKLSICRVPSKTPTLPPPQRQDASTDTAVDQTTALLARMPAAGDMDGNGVSGGVCGDVADEVEDDDECGYDDSEDIGNNIVDGECGDYNNSIEEVFNEN